MGHSKNRQEWDWYFTLCLPDRCSATELYPRPIILFLIFEVILFRAASFTFLSTKDLTSPYPHQHFTFWFSFLTVSILIVCFSNIICGANEPAWNCPASRGHVQETHERYIYCSEIPFRHDLITSKNNL